VPLTITTAAGQAHHFVVEVARTPEEHANGLMHRQSMPADHGMIFPYEPAQTVGLGDRGLLKPGYKADVNVIDMERLHLHAPHATYNLPAGGRRLSQRADGYEATIVSGVVTYRNGVATGALPGRLIRGARAAPAAA